MYGKGMLDTVDSEIYTSLETNKIISDSLITIIEQHYIGLPEGPDQKTLATMHTEIKKSHDKLVDKIACKIEQSKKVEYDDYKEDIQEIRKSLDNLQTTFSSKITGFNSLDFKELAFTLLRSLVSKTTLVIYAEAFKEELYLENLDYKNDKNK